MRNVTTFAFPLMPCEARHGGIVFNYRVGPSGLSPRCDPSYEQRDTNNVESFWRLFKNSVTSTHIHVSSKYMQRYLNEFAFRSNHRHQGNAMFDLLIAAL